MITLHLDEFYSRQIIKCLFSTIIIIIIITITRYSFRTKFIFVTTEIEFQVSNVISISKMQILIAERSSDVRISLPFFAYSEV